MPPAPVRYGSTTRTGTRGSGVVAGNYRPPPKPAPAPAPRPAAAPVARPQPARQQAPRPAPQPMPRQAPPPTQLPAGPTPEAPVLNPAPTTPTPGPAVQALERAAMPDAGPEGWQSVETPSLIRPGLGDRLPVNRAPLFTGGRIY